MFRIITCIIFALPLLSCQSQPLETIQKEINTISNRYVPDKRIAICDFHIETGKSGNQVILKGKSIFPNARLEIFKLLNNRSLTVVDSSVIFPDSARIQKFWGVVTLSVANMRSEPRHSAELVSQAIMGTPVRILDKNKEWYLIQTPDLYIAWTNQYAVQVMSDQEYADWKKAPRLIYTETSGNIYAGKDKSTVMSDLVAGAIVVKKSTGKDLMEVVLPDGRGGFVAGNNWLDFNQWRDTVSLNTGHMINFGKTFLGFPYLWGGTSSKGADCSGFAKTVCFLNGMVVERDASQQVKHGQPIDIENGLGNLEKGDLLFFGSKQPFKITHVGIYIGGGRVIHSSGFVHINSLEKGQQDYNEELRDNLVTARRIIGYVSETGLKPIREHEWY